MVLAGSVAIVSKWLSILVQGQGSLSQIIHIISTSIGELEKITDSWAVLFEPRLFTMYSPAQISVCPQDGLNSFVSGEDKIGPGHSKPAK